MKFIQIWALILVRDSKPRLPMSLGGGVLMNLARNLPMRDATELCKKLARVPGNSAGTWPLGQLLYLLEVTFMSGGRVSEIHRV